MPSLKTSFLVYGKVSIGLKMKDMACNTLNGGAVIYDAENDKYILKLLDINDGTTVVLWEDR